MNTLKLAIWNRLPDALKLKYKWFKLKHAHGDFAYRYESFTVRDSDFFFVSFPKSGRTWLKFMLSKYLFHVYGIPDDSSKIYKSSRISPNIPTISFTHDGSSYQPFNLSESNLLSNKSFYLTNKKAVLLVRDPRDVVVSYFHHATARKASFNGDISKFLRSEYWGIHKIIRFLNDWAQYTGNENLLLIRYEDLRNNEVASFKKIISFLDLKMDDATLENVVSESTFEKMKKLADKRETSTDILLPTNKDPNSAKVRRGKVGGYLTELSDDDLHFVNGAMSKLNKVYGYS